MGVNSQPSRPSRSKLAASRSLAMFRGKGDRSTNPPLMTAQQVQARLLMVWGLLMVSGLGLIVNLIRLQIFDAPKLKELAEQQQIVYLRPFVPRRPIVDRNNNVLAIDQPVYTLYAHPKLFKLSKDAIAVQLAPLLNRPPNVLMQQLNKGKSGLQLEAALPEDVASRIRTLQLDGLELIQHQQRFYPQQDLFADVVGYVNIDRQGQAGIEYSQQNLLERSVQAVKISRTGTGDLIPDQVPGGFLHADDLRLQLTLDSRLQRAARFELQKQVQQYGAKRGAVIVMDVRNGAIRALASTPSYDPNHYYKYNLERFKNWTLTDLYEPGSTFKPINVAIALEAGAIRPNSVFNDEGLIYVDVWPIANYDYNTAGPRGPVTVTEILQQSSNVGMVHIVQQMKRQVYYGWLERLGLGQTAGIDLPSEIPSQLKSQETFTQSPIEPATTAFGQGFSLTPIQLVQLHAAIANGGKLVTPHVVSGLVDIKGKFYWEPDSPSVRQVFSPSTARIVLEMMEKVVTDGTGQSAQIPGYRLAGKTGTAQKANSSGGYSEYAKITSFVSLFPVEAPRYVVLAVIDEPQGDNAFGSTVAAPIVKSVIETLITIDGIPPSQPIPKNSNPPQ